MTCSSINHASKHGRRAPLTRSRTAVKTTSTEPRRKADSPAQPTSPPAVNPFIAEHGLKAAMHNPLLAPELICTTRNVKVGAGTDQMDSGRCWIFAGLNLLRQKMYDVYGEDFQYSQNYVAFWDKYERANYVFEKMLELRGEAPDSQRFICLINDLYSDGGTWELFRNVVQKHGVVPQYAMPETTMATHSDAYTEYLEARVRELAGGLHRAARARRSTAALHAQRDQALQEVRTCLEIFLGTPPKTFVWSVPGAQARGRPRFVQMTPQEFLAENPCRLDTLVHLSSFPNHPWGVRLCVRDVNNVVGAPGMTAFNVPMDELKQATRNSLKADTPVMMCSEVRSRDRKSKVWALHADGVPAALGMRAGSILSKGDRLTYRATEVAHGMLFTGCDEPIATKYRGEPLHGALGEIMQPMWRVENSWKENNTMYMTDAWVDEYVYDVVVEPRYLPASLRRLVRGETAPDLHVPAWDPFGRV